MLFNSIQFLLFFPVVVLVYFIVPQRAKNLWLLLCSYFFYMCWNARYALLLLFSTVVTWLSSLVIDAVRSSALPESKKAIALRLAVFFSVFANLAILFYFKYSNFALGLVHDFFALFHVELVLPVFDIILPVGISFYTFQALGYTIDVYRGDIRSERSFLRYALFVSFFPQLVAGPIERSKNLLSQISEPKRFCYDDVRSGLLLMLWGYFLKIVISDRCAVLVNTVYGQYQTYAGWQLIIATVFFSIQIYCDFMGYSLIAKGAAQVLGFRLMNNFARPYLAQSVRDFWRRWHISLSTWFRDYLYIPLGGSRCSKLKKCRNLLVTFLVSGLWHGASLTFVVWGALHGIYQILETAITPPPSRHAPAPEASFSQRLLRICRTGLLVDIAWVFFRADTIKAALEILQRACTFSNIGLLLNGGLYNLGLNERNMSFLLLALGALLVHSLMEEKGFCVETWLKKQNFIFRYALYWSAVVLIIFSLDITGQEFIYFQF